MIRLKNVLRRGQVVNSSKTYNGKVFKKEKEGGGQSALVPFRIIDSDAYQVLRPSERAIYFQMYRRFNGNNNGYIPYSCREMADDCNVGKMTAQRAFRKLEEVGLIECLVPSSFNSRKKLAREWAFLRIIL